MIVHMVETITHESKPYPELAEAIQSKEPAVLASD
jgi:hypothetical protein